MERAQPAETVGLVRVTNQGSKTHSEDEVSIEDTGDTKRGHWANKLDSLLSLVGYCVGYGNIWRFPYFCMRNGGGSFLVAFLIVLIVCGLPTFFLDLAIGQFSGKTSLHAWQICPLLQGIEGGSLIVLFVINTYYNMIIAWTLFYLGSSFLSPLPWSTCTNSWNTEHCVGNRTRYRLLEISPGIDVIGSMPWHQAVCFLAAWILTFLCLIKGIRSSGKVVYVTALLPYVILTAIFIRALLLPGAGDGLLYYFTPNLHRLSEAQVWLEAALQVFYSLGPGWGPLITIASYNKFNNNCFRDSILMVFICEGTSIYGGMVMFAVLGFMSHETGIKISEVITSGPGVVFMIYPEALAHFPIPNMWTVLFFLMMITVGLDSQLSCVETILSAILDHFPVLRGRRFLVQVVSCVMWFLLGLILCTQGGMYVFILLDWYVIIAIPLFAFLECIIVGWIYGAERFSRDVELMLGRGIPILVRIAICFVAPSILLIIFVCTLATYKTPTYGQYKFPPYTPAFGFILGLIPLIPLIYQAIRAIRRAEGDTFFKRMKNACRPSPDWKPASRVHALDYTYHDLSDYNSIYNVLKINLRGPENMT